jgi:hypothetical protein
MVRSTRLAAGLALLGLAQAGDAQAQDVHKCTINGAVIYQSTPCTSGDVVLQAPPTPSDQEARQARNDLNRQHLQAATGRIWRQTLVPPPPPPPPPPRVATSTTTVIVLPNAGQGAVIVRQTRTTTTVATPPPKPRDNCEKLNWDNNEALDRRDQLRTPSDLASHAAMLQKAEADVTRVSQLASAANCHLLR